MFVVFCKICIKLIINYIGSVAQIKSKAGGKLHKGDSQNFETAPQGGSTKIIFFWEKVKPGPSPYLFWAKNAFFWPFSMFFSH